MTNQEVVLKVLEKTGCLTSNQISCFAKRNFGVTISPSAVGGALRALALKNKVASSNCGNGATVYWVIR